MIQAGEAEVGEEEAIDTWDMNSEERDISRGLCSEGLKESREINSWGRG